MSYKHIRVGIYGKFLEWNRWRQEAKIKKKIDIWVVPFTDEKGV